jgi:hypothetical protein
MGAGAGRSDGFFPSFLLSVGRTAYKEMPVVPGVGPWAMTLSVRFLLLVSVCHAGCWATRWLLRGLCSLLE